MKIYAASGTGLFRNFTLTILAFYVVTVWLLVIGIYYIIVVQRFENFYTIAVLAASVTILAGVVIAKMAIEPLRQHFEHLENFSKETLHELNLPINTIMANTAMLRRTHSDDKSRKRIDRIEAAVVMLQERYNELDYLIAAQMHRERVDEFDLSEMIQERLEFLHSLYPQMKFNLDLEPIRLNLDKIGLRKVIDNLIDNAVKYSEKEKRVDIRLKGPVLEIQDYGKGMDEVELFRIFDRYYQSDAMMPGYGIGLGLVKSFCDKYKIMLHVRSAKGKGTTMILDFKEINNYGK